MSNNVINFKKEHAEAGSLVRDLKNRLKCLIAEQTKSYTGEAISIIGNVMSLDISIRPCLKKYDTSAGPVYYSIITLLLTKGIIDNKGKPTSTDCINEMLFIIINCIGDITEELKFKGLDIWDVEGTEAIAKVDLYFHLNKKFDILFEISNNKLNPENDNE